MLHPTLAICHKTPARMLTAGERLRICIAGIASASTTSADAARPHAGLQPHGHAALLGKTAQGTASRQMLPGGGGRPPPPLPRVCASVSSSVRERESVRACVRDATRARARAFRVFVCVRVCVCACVFARRWFLWLWYCTVPIHACFQTARGPTRLIHDAGGLCSHNDRHAHTGPEYSAHTGPRQCLDH
jgi:hypothetical protein